MSVHAVIPLKDPVNGKTRLSSALATPLRMQLIRAMLEHVASCLATSRHIAEVNVLTSRPYLVPRGCAYLCDEGLDLNSAVTHAARELRARGATGTLLVLHGDLPFVTPQEIGDLIAASGEDVIVAAPDSADVGTNALTFSLSREVTPRFGACSLAAHSEAARAAGMAFKVLRRPGLANDIDEPSQLATLAETGGERYAFLKSAVR